MIRQYLRRTDVIQTAMDSYRPALFRPGSNHP